MTVEREYPDDTEVRPGYFRAGVRSPWNVYQVVDSSDRKQDRRFADVFNEANAPRVAAALNAAVDAGVVFE